MASNREERLDDLESNGRRLLGGDPAGEVGWSILSLDVANRITGYLVSVSLAGETDGTGRLDMTLPWSWMPETS